MALLHCNIISEVLRVHIGVEVILPEVEPPKDGFKTLWLLHGLSDNHTSWTRYTSVERYASEVGLAVIMPDVNRSFYANSKLGGNLYWDFISEELPKVMRRFFKLSTKREDNFVAGLSMGGYGAFKLALEHPERYCFAGSFSGGLDMANLKRDLPHEKAINEQILQEMKDIFGDFGEEMRAAGGDIVYTAANVTDPAKYPKFYQCCGTEDFVYPANVEFINAARNSGLDIEYVEEPGDHVWSYWDRHVEIFIKKIGELC